MRISLFALLLLASAVTHAGEPSATTMPRVDITMPSENAKIGDHEFPIVVRGSVLPGESSLSRWTLAVRREGAAAREVARGVTGVSNDVLATLKLGGATRLRPGHRYVLELEATDLAGRSARVTRNFRIPRMRFARIPLPNRFDNGGFDHVISDDGTRISFVRAGRDENNVLQNVVWLFDTTTRELREVEWADFPTISGDGRFLFFSATKISGTRGTLYDIDTKRELIISRSFFPGFIDAHGTSFTSIIHFSTQTLPDAGFGVFLLDFDTQTTTRISQGPLPQYVDSVAISSNGPFTAFSTATPLDSTASTGGLSQIFVYDARDTSVRQFTNREEPAASASSPALSADGSTLAYRIDDHAVRVVELPSGRERLLLDVSQEGDYIYNYFLSADGQYLGFTSSANLDPSVGNEDHGYQVFRLNVATGVVQQVTDADIGAFTAMDGTAGTFVLEYGGEVHVGSESFYLNTDTRVVPRRRVNAPPTLAVPASVRTYQGRTTSITFTSTDPDGDPITYYAQLADPSVTQLRRHFSSVFDDHGDGTARLSLTPNRDLSGSFRLQVATFDEAGAVALRAIDLSVEPVHPAGDANCDGRVAGEDVSPLLQAVVGLGALPDCIESGDVNGDGQLTVTDLITLLTR